MKNKKRLDMLYKEISELLLLAPPEDECTDKENDMYADMANLKESLAIVVAIR